MGTFTEDADLGFSFALDPVEHALHRAFAIFEGSDGRLRSIAPT